jgi:hypothetical protein
LICLLIFEFKPNAKLNYAEFNEIVGILDFGYGSLTRSNNNHFVLTAGLNDGSITLRTTNDLVNFESA